MNRSQNLPTIILIVIVALAATLIFRGMQPRLERINAHYATMMSASSQGIDDTIIEFAHKMCQYVYMEAYINSGNSSIPFEAVGMRGAGCLFNRDLVQNAYYEYSSGMLSDFLGGTGAYREYVDSLTGEDKKLYEYEIDANVRLLRKGAQTLINSGR